MLVDSVSVPKAWLEHRKVRSNVLTIGPLTSNATCSFMEKNMNEDQLELLKEEARTRPLLAVKEGEAEDFETAYKEEFEELLEKAAAENTNLNATVDRIVENTERKKDAVADMTARRLNEKLDQILGPRKDAQK